MVIRTLLCVCVCGNCDERSLVSYHHRSKNSNRPSIVNMHQVYIQCKLNVSSALVTKSKVVPKKIHPDWLNPGPVFDQVGFDYAGPIMVKSRSPRKPFVTKAYVCVFVSFTVKAVHLEPVSELTKAAFKANLRRFMA